MVGTLLHMIPILSSSGLSPVGAAIVASSLGLTTVLGKVICGLLVNRVPGHLISAGLLVLPVITFSALMVPSDSVVLRTLEVTPLGLALGGQLKMVVYMTTRYFGLRAFGSIFGFITVGLTVSSSGGPFLTSYLYDLAHDYHLVLTAGIPLALVGSLVMLSIGGYPELARTGSGEAAIAGGKA
jgi:predicted MFS family arabinose efflux permease